MAVGAATSDPIYMFSRVHVRMSQTSIRPTFQISMQMSFTGRVEDLGEYGQIEYVSFIPIPQSLSFHSIDRVQEYLVPIWDQRPHGFH